VAVFLVSETAAMSTSSPAGATLDDLYAVEGKAELIAGRIVTYKPSGFAPSRAAMKIVLRLEVYAEDTKSGLAFPDGLGYALKQPLINGRQSFCPDASFYTGSPPKNRMRFIDGVPVLAVEVRSEGDYGEAAEERLAAKRADYFEAGTQVVWDVDPLARTIAVYRSSAPEQPDVFSSGQSADAEPAAPGFVVPVNEVFA
jgi:Uma2 family endonuclease